MKMEDVVPRARRVQHQGQVASSVATEGLNTSGTHMVRAAYPIGVSTVQSGPLICFTKSEFLLSVGTFVAPSQLDYHFND